MSVNDVTIYITIMLVTSLALYMKHNKLFGGMLMFISGIGAMYAEPTHAWVGFVFLAIGVAMMVDDVLTPMSKKNRIKRRRR